VRKKHSPIQQQITESKESNNKNDPEKLKENSNVSKTFQQKLITTKKFTVNSTKTATHVNFSTKQVMAIASKEHQ
jgi:hypothetical protein